MNLVTYKPVLNWRKIESVSKLYPIHLRITIDRTHRYFPVELPQKVHKEEWANKINAWVKNTHPFAFEINNTIKEKLDLLNAVVERY